MSTKRNLIVPIEFEHAFFETAVQHFGTANKAKFTFSKITRNNLNSIIPNKYLLKSNFKINMQICLHVHTDVRSAYEKFPEFFSYGHLKLS